MIVSSKVRELTYEMIAVHENVAPREAPLAVNDDLAMGRQEVKGKKSSALRT